MDGMLLKPRDLPVIIEQGINGYIGEILLHLATDLYRCMPVSPDHQDHHVKML